MNLAFKQGINDVFTFDIIRFCKLFEMFQDSVVIILIILPISYIINKHYYTKKHSNKKHSIHEFLTLFFI